MAQDDAHDNALWMFVSYLSSDEREALMTIGTLSCCNPLRNALQC